MVWDALLGIYTYTHVGRVIDKRNDNGNLDQHIHSRFFFYEQIPGAWDLVLTYTNLSSAYIHTLYEGEDNNTLGIL